MTKESIRIEAAHPKGFAVFIDVKSVWGKWRVMIGQRFVATESDRDKAIHRAGCVKRAVEESGYIP